MIEDGTMAGEGLTFLETFTYFFVAPTVLFVVISFSLTSPLKRLEQNQSVSQ